MRFKLSICCNFGYVDKKKLNEVKAAENIPKRVASEKSEEDRFKEEEGGKKMKNVALF